MQPDEEADGNGGVCQWEDSRGLLDERDPIPNFIDGCTGEITEIPAICTEYEGVLVPKLTRSTAPGFCRRAPTSWARDRRR